MTYLSMTEVLQEELIESKQCWKVDKYLQQWKMGVNTEIY
jgi:hypothetical protein